MTDTVTFWLALVALVLASISNVLHYIAPRTKTTLDDRAAVEVDKVKAHIDELKDFLVKLLKPAAMLVVIMFAVSCAAAKRDAAIVKNDAIACAKQDLGQTVESAGMSLLGATVGILVADGLNWQADLDALAQKYGPEALACAAKIAGDLVHPAAGSAATTPQGLLAAPAQPADVAYQRSQIAVAKYGGGRAFE